MAPEAEDVDEGTQTLASVVVTAAAVDVVCTRVTGSTEVVFSATVVGVATVVGDTVVGLATVVGVTVVEVYAPVVAGLAFDPGAVP